MTRYHYLIFIARYRVKISLIWLKQLVIVQVRDIRGLRAIICCFLILGLFLIRICFIGFSTSLGRMSSPHYPMHMRLPFKMKMFEGFILLFRTLPYIFFKIPHIYLIKYLSSKQSLARRYFLYVADRILNLTVP